jgi:hypothetical protein
MRDRADRDGARRPGADPRDPQPLRFSQVAPLLLSGPGWTQHTYPAPGIWIN